MADNKKGFLLYADQIHVVETLTDEEAGKFVKHLYRYVNDQNPQTDDRIILIAFEPIKQQLKRDLKAWEQEQGHRSNAGQLGNIKKWHPDLYAQITAGTLALPSAIIIAKDRKASPSDKNVANIAVNVNDTVTVNVNEKIESKDKKRFTAPTLTEATDYFISIGVTADQEHAKFIDYYTANGWKVGRNPMKDWKAAARNWKKNIKTFTNGHSTTDHQPPERIGRASKDDLTTFATTRSMPGSI